MPRLLKQLQTEPDLVQKYAAAFAKEPALKEVGSLTSFLSKRTIYIYRTIVSEGMHDLTSSGCLGGGLQFHHSSLQGPL